MEILDFMPWIKPIASQSNSPNIKHISASSQPPLSIRSARHEISYCDRVLVNVIVPAFWLFEFPLGAVWIIACTAYRECEYNCFGLLTTWYCDFNVTMKTIILAFLFTSQRVPAQAVVFQNRGAPHLVQVAFVKKCLTILCGPALRVAHMSSGWLDVLLSKPSASGCRLCQKRQPPQRLAPHLLIILLRELTL